MENLPNTNPMNESPADFSDSDDLLHSLTYAIRRLIFSSWDDVVVGVMLEENEDSFLVALPVKEINVDGTIWLKDVQTGGDPFIRILKSAVRIVSSPSENVDRKYIEIIAHKAPHVFPELLGMIGLEDIDELEMDGEEPSSDENEQMQEPAPANIPGGGVLVNPENVSNQDIEEKIKKAAAEGYFIPTHVKFMN